MQMAIWRNHDRLEQFIEKKQFIAKFMITDSRIFNVPYYAQHHTNYRPAITAGVFQLAKMPQPLTNISSQITKINEARNAQQ